ncbi:MAG TPA: hypothetical protein VNX69_18690 [Steroidobacteraceae bacterium]|nr:hypothetical protein [Steroidobacteraceae bacterium]
MPHRNASVAVIGAGDYIGAAIVRNFGSPNAFLSHRVIPAIEARTGVRFDYVPVLLGGIFKATEQAILAKLSAPK